MLIGIMHHASGPPGGFSPFKDHSRILHSCDIFWSSSKILTSEGALDLLSAFRQEWRRSVQFLVPFDFSRSTGLCPDVLALISEYLSLNEAINACSLSILPLFHQTRSKVHLSNPSDRFLEMIPQYVDPREIASLRITDDLSVPTGDISALQTFDQLTVLATQGINTAISLLIHLPTIRHVSLWLPDEFRSCLFTHLQDLFSYPITHLHVHCADAQFDHFPAYNPPFGRNKNANIVSILLGSGYSLPQQDMCELRQRGPLVPLPYPNIQMNFIQLLTNVRRVRLIVNEFQIQAFLNANQWREVIHGCVHLNRVIMQTANPGDFTEAADVIEEELRQLRPGLIFRVKTI